MPIVARDFPPIGIGTFGSDRYTPAEVGAAVASALRLGYRLVDCAAVYGNEAEVGAAAGPPRLDADGPAIRAALDGGAGWPKGWRGFALTGAGGE